MTDDILTPIEEQGHTEISEQEEVRYWQGTTHSGTQWQIHCGDALEVLRELPEASFDCVITSPPYFWLRDYGSDAQIGLEENVADYVNAISGVMDEVHRVLKPSGVLFLNLGDTYYSGKGKPHGVDPKSAKRRFGNGIRAVDKSGGMGIGLRPKSIIGMPWRVAINMTLKNWILRSPIIWHRQHCLPESVKDRPRRTYEFIFMFTKGRRYYFNRQSLTNAGEEDMWTIAARPKSTNGIETAPFPDELVQRCLELGCPTDGVVLDPFAGSGTTLRVSVATGRSSTGVDTNLQFCEYMVGKLQQL